MKCFYCGREIDDDAHFCPLCGRDLSQLIKCPHCGSLLERDSKFCVHCGSPVASSDKEAPSEIVTDDDSVQNANSLVDDKQEELEEDIIDNSQNHTTNQDKVVAESEMESKDLENISDDGGNKNSHRGLIWVFVVIILILGCIGAGWYFHNYQQGTPNSTTNGSLEVQPISVDSSAENDNQKQNVEYIKQRLEDIYANALQNQSESSDDAYLTSSFNALIKEAKEKALQNSEPLFDYDHWIMGQESNKPSMQIEKISINDDTAVAQIVINDYWDDGQSSQVKVRDILKFEHGDWYIDDFQKVEEGKIIDSNRADAETYLKYY